MCNVNFQEAHTSPFRHSQVRGENTERRKLGEKEMRWMTWAWWGTSWALQRHCHHLVLDWLLYGHGSCAPFLLQTKMSGASFGCVSLILHPCQAQPRDPQRRRGERERLRVWQRLNSPKPQLCWCLGSSLACSSCLINTGWIKLNVCGIWEEDRTLALSSPCLGALSSLELERYIWNIPHSFL